MISNLNEEHQRRNFDLKIMRENKKAWEGKCIKEGPFCKASWTIFDEKLIYYFQMQLN